MRKVKLMASTGAAVAAVFSAGTAHAQTSGAVHPNWGSIDAFWGDIDAFWGDIDAFAGTSNPFWGNIDAFWGDIDAFQGAANPFWGDIDAFWGDIDAFQGGVHPQWGDIDAFWGAGQNSTGVGALWTSMNANWTNAEKSNGARNALQVQFRDLVTRSQTFWGSAVTAETGKSFWDGFAKDVFAKHGIDINRTSTFRGFTGVERTRFFFDWYDGLMGFSGRDHVDWWMDVSRWTPALTQIQGSGVNTTIGLLDFSLRDTDLVNNKIVWAWYGYDNPMGGHGGAVASLLVADHDGRGIMGIAPKARIAAHNPFDATGTAGWDDISIGISNLSLQGARVINMSLGVPGWTLHSDWRDLYSRWNIRPLANSTIFVHAAGNEGVTQSQNIAWNFAYDPNILIVGSVGPSGVISDFSNRPGNACLLDNGVCLPANRLMNRFLVAPGEWILVSDNKGGVTRQSGTSFAAPLVTGAIALLHDRWGWLSSKPDETIQIILSTTRDLGAPGVDPVYGHGLLDITASQSPIDFSRLYRLETVNGVSQKVFIQANPSLLQNGVWTSSSGVLTAFEDVGQTYRDFMIPVSATLSASATTGSRMAQSYISDSFLSWVSTSQTVSVTNATGPLLLGESATSGVRLSNPWGWDMRAAAYALPYRDGAPRDGLPMATEISVMSPDGAVLSVGQGVGAMALSGESGMAVGRFDSMMGGVNPVLGFASGGSYARFAAPLAGSTRVSMGVTSQETRREYADPLSGEIRAVNPALAPYKASAVNVGVEQPLGARMMLTAAYTQLHEANAALGVQSTDAQAFSGGTITDAATLGMTWQAAERLSFSLSGTLANSRGNDRGDGALGISKDGVKTSALEAALNASSVFAANDRARIALVQPLHVEDGSLSVTEQVVADRMTGALGTQARSLSIDEDAREFALEAMYARPILNGAATAAGFVRAEGAMADGVRTRADHIAGGSLTFRF